jgi:hypothetical protein
MQSVTAQQGALVTLCRPFAAVFTQRDSVTERDNLVCHALSGIVYDSPKAVTCVTHTYRCVTLSRSAGRPDKLSVLPESRVGATFKPRSRLSQPGGRTLSGGWSGAHNHPAANAGAPCGSAPQAAGRQGCVSRAAALSHRQQRSGLSAAHEKQTFSYRSAGLASSPCESEAVIGPRVLPLGPVVVVLRQNHGCTAFVESRRMKPQVKSARIKLCAVLLMDLTKLLFKMRRSV